MLTLGGQILQSNREGKAMLRPGVVQIGHEQIVAVEFGSISTKVDLGGENALICPGLIDTHLHLPQFDSIGAAGMKLLPWLSEVIFPAEMRWNDLAHAQSMIQRVIDQCLAVGTTGICAYATVSHDATIAALMAFQEAGFRGVIGQVMMDRSAPQELLRPASQLADEVDQTLALFPPGSPMAAAVTPRFALSCSETLMELAGRLAASHQAIIQTHLAETMNECSEVRKQFDGKDYVEVYEDAGLISSRSLLGHCIHLNPASQRRLAKLGGIIAHCPTANSFLGSGMMNRYSHGECGIPMTLGSDIGAGFERSMVRVGRAMIETAMRTAIDNGVEIDDSDWIPSAPDAWHQITAGNAEALGWADAGRIQTGVPADILVVEPDLPWQDSRCPLSTLMFAWDDRWIKQTLLRGRVKYSSGLFDQPSSS